LHRFYGAPYLTIIPKVFNEITGLDLRLSVVRNQFDSHFKLYGGRAYPEYGKAISVPFQDVYGVYTDIHHIIEETVNDLIVAPQKRG
jgi:hypothetical protein